MDKDGNNGDNNSDSRAVHLKILQWNSRSLKNKLDDLKQEIHDDQIDIACIQETWLLLSLIHI